MGQDFEGRHVVVTGGGGALGAAVLEHLLARGATCHVPMAEVAVPAGFAFARHERVRATPSGELFSSKPGVAATSPPRPANITNAITVLVVTVPPSPAACRRAA